MREIPQQAIRLIEEFEGFVGTPYFCPAGKLSIGYGHVILPTESFKSITKDEGLALLLKDLKPMGEAILKAVNVPLDDNQYAALLSFVYNVGPNRFRQSTLLRYLNKGIYDQVPVQLMRWTKANGEVLGGLSRRRAAEGRLWNTR